LCLQEQAAAAAAWAEELPLLKQTAAAQIEAAKQQLAQVTAMFKHLKYSIAVEGCSAVHVERQLRATYTHQVLLLLLQPCACIAIQLEFVDFRSYVLCTAD
jgi:hypothetical protein